MGVGRQLGLGCSSKGARSGGERGSGGNAANGFGLHAK